MNQLKYDLTIRTSTTNLFKNAKCPDSLNMALDIASKNDVTTDFINKYFDNATDNKHQFIKIVQRPYCFEIVKKV